MEIAPSPVNEQEEFEFRARLEAEQGSHPAPADPSMPQVMGNAVPKGMANLLNTPITIANLIMMGLSNLPGAGHLTGLQTLAAEPELKANAPMEAMTQAGLIDPAKNPQTGPQRIVDAAIQAAIGAAAVPGGGLAGAVRGAAVGAGSAAAAQTTKELTGSDLLAVAVGVASPLVLRALADTTKVIATDTQKITLKEAQQAGFVVEPSSVRQPPSVLENVAGKASIAQEAVVRNQVVANKLAAKALGLPEDTPLSPSLLHELKEKIAKPYHDVEQLRASGTQLEWFPRFHSASLLEELKQARESTKELYRQYYRTPDVGVLKAAKAAAAEAQSIEADIDRVATALGKPELLLELKAARMLYAKIADVEKAMNVGTGNVSMPILGRMLDKGAPLSGELRLIGKFSQAFPRVAREVESVPPAGVSALNAAGSAALGMGGAAATGHPLGAAAAALPALRSPARNRVLSEGFQSGLLREPPAPPSVGQTAGRAAIVGTTVEENQP